MQIEITIGWTKSNMPEYSSFGDGYRVGAEQHVETIEVQSHGTTGIYADAPTEEAVSQIAEAVFIATNSPFVTDPLAMEIADAIEATGYHGHGAHYSLSVGDTVTVGDITMACDHMGWKRVSMEVQV